MATVPLTTKFVAVTCLERRDNDQLVVIAIGENGGLWMRTTGDAGEWKYLGSPPGAEITVPDGTL